MDELDKKIRDYYEEYGKTQRLRQYVTLATLPVAFLFVAYLFVGLEDIAACASVSKHINTGEICEACLVIQQKVGDDRFVAPYLVHVNGSSVYEETNGSEEFWWDQEKGLVPH